MITLPELPILVWPTTAVCTSYLTGEQADCLLRSTPTDWLGPASEDFDGFVADRRGGRTRWNVPSTIFWYVSSEHYLGTLVIRRRLTEPPRRSWRSYRVSHCRPLAAPGPCHPDACPRTRRMQEPRPLGCCSPVTPATRRLTASYSPTAGSPRAEPPAKTASGSLSRIVDKRTRQPTECPPADPRLDTPIAA